MHVTAQRPQAANPTAGEASTDAANPNVMNAGLTGPAGASHKPLASHRMHKPQDAPHGIAGDNANPEVWEVDERTRMAQGIDEEDQVETPIDETTNTHANGTRAGQRHNANAHGEGRCAWAEWHTGHTTSDLAQVPDGIIEDPGGRTEPSDGTAASAPSGGRPARVSSGRRRRRIPTCAVRPGGRHTLTRTTPTSPGASEIHPGCWGSGEHPRAPGPEPEDSEPGTRRPRAPIDCSQAHMLTSDPTRSLSTTVVHVPVV
ncbi:hypothetical protein BU15DRAFT_60998 [Melanogaster broomeanus]|nr:hypothetical protein BU15DRAFT_60998 [Melanogaster broomeanus]